MRGKDEDPSGSRDPSLLTRARELFGEALDLPAPRRETYVRERARADRPLRELVLELLRERESLGSFLRSTPFHASGLAETPETAGSEGDPSGLLSPGTRLGDFEIQELVAGGGTGEVYRACQLSLGRREVALKILHPGRISSRERERFLREAKLAARVHHPHLVAVHGSGEDNERGILYYAMRFVEGPSLLDVLFLLSRSEDRQKCDRPSISRELVRRITEVADGLATLHERGLIHGDVKPGNIVLEGGAGAAWSRPAVLVDFGLVRHADEIVSTVWATPGYAAPEVLLGRPVDARSDVFALGVSLHDLLARRLPDRRRAAGAPDEPERLSTVAPGVDLDLEAIVARATDHDPARRYADAAGLRDDLLSWLEGHPVTARRLVGRERVRRWIRRNPEVVLRWVGISAAGIVLTTVLVLGITRVVDLVSSTTAARQAWSRSDFERLPPTLVDSSPFLSRIFLPEELANAADALRRGDAADPVGRVLLALTREGPVAGRLLAAAFLERDGLLAHPALRDYLLQMLDDLDPEAKAEGVRLIGRLFHERPDRSPEEVVASAPFRRALMDLLLSEETDIHTSLHALTALSGCGTDERLPELVDWLLQTRVEEETLLAERLRLGLRALGRIFLRAHSCGLVDRVCSSLDADYLRRLRTRIEPFEERLPIYPFFLGEAYWHIYRNLVLLHRANRTPPPPFEAVRLRDPVPLEVLGALRDTGLSDAIVSRLPPLGDELPSPTLVQLTMASTAVGILDDPRLAGEVEERIQVWLARATALHGEIPSIWREQLESGRRLAHGDFLPFEPDTGTHMGHLLQADEHVWEEEDLPRAPAESSLLLARWDLREDAVPGTGEELGLALLGPSASVARWPTEEHIVLGLPGVSAMRLSFRCPHSSPPRQLRLRLQAQKAVRTLVPWAGEASLDFFLDGKASGTGIPLTEGSVEEVVLPLVRRSPIERQSHEVVIRLSPESTTTVWILRAEITFVEAPK